MTEAMPRIDPSELERCRPLLIKYAMLHVRNPAAAEDAVQETLVSALQSIESFAGRSSVSTWLVGILKHKIIDTIRRQSREQPLGLDETDSSVSDLDALFLEDGHIRDQPSDWGNPEAALSQTQFFEVLERCMQGLPKNAARVFTMREMMSLETDAICEELGITQSNCWVLLYRARMRLRECLEQNWFKGADR